MKTSEVTPELASMEAILTDMQSDSAAYLRGLADGVMKAVRVIEGSATEAEQRGLEADVVTFRQVANILKTRLGVGILAQSMALTVGNFSASTVDGSPHSMRVKLDDRPIAVTGFQVDFKVGNVPTVQIQIVPFVTMTRNEG